MYRRSAFPIHSMPLLSLAPLMLILVLLSGSNSLLHATGLEQPGSTTAASVLPQELRKGPYHTVDDKVVFDGFFYRFTLQSPFGTFNADSQGELNILIHELQAIAEMRKVETEDTAVSSFKKSGENTVQGLKNLFSDPEGTLEGAATGIGSLFNRAKETVGKREITETEDSRLAQLVGFSKSKGEIATRYGVNIYSRNQVLEEELDRLAYADYLGGLSVGLVTSVVPGAGGLVLTASGTARLLNEAINTTPASELWLQNKNRLLTMEVDEDTAELFLNNPYFSPALATVLTTALQEMQGVANRKLFAKIGLQASDPSMARLMTEMAVMAASYHKRIKPLRSFHPMARLALAKNRDGGVVVLLPVDHLIWTGKVARAADGITRQGQQDGVGSFELWNYGTFSDRAATSLESMGWQLHDQARKDLFPKQGK